jgi:hypothetical protein
METRTAADGSYEFSGILRGSYTLTEFQPMGLVDGKDMVDGQQSLRNDRYEIELPAGEVVGDYNFGERGLAPEWIRDPFFFASRTPHGLLAMMNLAGEMEWYCVDEGWVGLETVEAELSPNFTTVEVTVHDSVGGNDSAVVRLNSDRDARLFGSGSGGRLMRLVGDPQDFGLNPTAGEGELTADAVDAAFAGDDA